MLLADDAAVAGPAAIVTACGGVAVSLATVWLNSRRQAGQLAETEAGLQAEVERLRGEVALLTKRLVHAEEARVERDRLMELCNLYGGRKLRKRLLDIDLRR
jgi:hypothetical protein